MIAAPTDGADEADTPWQGPLWPFTSLAPAHHHHDAPAGIVRQVLLRTCVMQHNRCPKQPWHVGTSATAPARHG